MELHAPMSDSFPTNSIGSNNNNNNKKKNTSDDDEALARYLQYQEQSGGNDDHHLRVQAGVILSDQELNDMVLARQMAEMELADTSTLPSGYGYSSVGGVGRSNHPSDFSHSMSSLYVDSRANNISNSHASGSNLSSSWMDDRQLQGQAYQQQHRLLQQNQQHQQEHSPHRVYIELEQPQQIAHSPPKRSHRSFQSYDAGASTRSLGGGTRRLKGHGSFDSSDSRGSGVGGVGLTDLMARMEHDQFQMDLELARRIQQEEAMQQHQHSNTSAAAAAAENTSLMSYDTGGAGTAVPPPGASWDDERLARLMASTGRSLRDLTKDELDQLFAQDVPRTAATPQQPPRSRHDGSGGGMSRSSPSSPVVNTTRPKLQPFPHDDTTTTTTMMDQPQQLQHHRSAPATPTASSKPSAIPRLRKPPPAPAPGIPAGIAPAPSLGDAGGIPAGIPSAIPPPPRGLTPNHPPCAKCGLYDGTFLRAKELYYHPECFRCGSCHEKIDFHSKFGVRFSQTTQQQEPYHAHCLPYSKSDLCVVCQKPLVPRETINTSHNNNPATGPICFVKHPFFSNERMCPEHANRGAVAANGTNNGTSQLSRRCTSCRRFEPIHEPFADLDDAGRCVCFACCRTVIMDGSDLIPLWKQVVHFFEHQMKLPIGNDFRELPVFCVGIQELQTQIAAAAAAAACRRHRSTHHQHPHQQSTQIMTRGLCLTDHTHCGQLKMPSMKFNWSSSSFEAQDRSGQAYTYHDFQKDTLPAAVVMDKHGAQQQRDERPKPFAIMVLSGLTRDLTAAILAHQATHAWFQLHPDYCLAFYPLADDDPTTQDDLHPHVEEGVAQLVAMLFLNEGLEPPQPLGEGDAAPSDEELREYYRFCIETDDSQIYGQGYKKAAKAYREIGIQALVKHVLVYRTFPEF